MYKFILIFSVAFYSCSSNNRTEEKLREKCIGEINQINPGLTPEKTKTACNCAAKKIIERLKSEKERATDVLLNTYKECAEEAIRKTKPDFVQ
jgi:hypothetical protein